MLGGFLYGFDIGATSFVLFMLLNDDDDDDNSSSSEEAEEVWWNDEDFSSSSARQGMIVSGMSLGALIGSHIVLTVLSKRIVGRRMELRLCSIFYVLGSCFNVASGTILKNNRRYYSSLGFWCLFVGRILYGIGVGFVMHGAPAYLAEMSPHTMRGAIVSAKETIIVTGIVVGSVVGNWMTVSDCGFRWTDLYGLCGLLASPMFFLTYRIPRSKRWLLLHGFHDEAYESMKFVYDGDITNEYDTLVASCTTTVKMKSSSSSMTTMTETTTTKNPPAVPTNNDDPSLFDARYRKAIFASVGLIIFQQLSGQPSVLSYATILFEAAGWSGNASVVSSVLMMIASAVTVALVERVGRKFLLCTGCLIMMVALFILSESFWDWDERYYVTANDESSDDNTRPQNLKILCAMFSYIAGYQLCFGPITWCIVSETFPLEIRSKAIAAMVELNYALNFAVQFAFPTMKERLGWGRTFCVFSACLGLAIFYIQIFVPETTGLTLEEIETKLAATATTIDDDDDRRSNNRLVLRKKTKRECNNNRLLREGHHHNVVTEKTNLLRHVDSSSLLGAHPSLEEMENQIIRTSSAQAIR
jgi:sugar porter (SP) family MFS transporter